MKKYLLLFFLVCISSYKAQVGIGITIPNSKSVLDIESTKRGVLMPRLTTSERDAINPEGSANPNGVDGLLIYNIDTDCYNYWNRATLSWVSMCQTATTCDPSTWSELDINCGQFPAADTNIYNIGTATAGFTINISVNVSKIGPYAVSIVSNNGVTYSTTGTFTVTGVQNITLTSNDGAPTSSPINFSVKANGATVCNYTKSATTTFTYSTACTSTTPALSSFNFTQGSAASGTFTIPLSVSGTGNIPSLTGTQSGITLTTAAITGATNSNTSLTVTISGTPTASGAITIPLTINGTPCSYTFNVDPIAIPFSYTYNCNSATVNPAMVRGVNQSGTITVPVSVVGSGNIPAINQTINGVTYTYIGGTYSAGTSTVVLNYSGTPNTDSTILPMTNSNGTTCNVNINHPFGNAVFSCGAPAPSLNGTYNVDYPLDATNSLTVNVNVTTPGNYPSTTYTGGGMTFSNAGGTFTSTGTFPIVYTATGTPITSGNNVLTKSNTSLCDVVVNVGYGNAVFTCSSPVVTGNYIVETNLTTNEKVTMNFNVTRRGNVAIVSEDKNGIKFGLTTQFTTLGAVSNVTIPNVTASFANPQTSEEVTNGANGGNNQTASYSFTNNGTPMGCPVTIDVKPKLITGTVINSSSTNWLTVGYTGLGAADSRIRLELSTKYYGFGSLQNGTGNFWNAPLRNISGSNVTYDISGSSTYDLYRLTLNNATLANNAILGSIDPYNPVGTRINGDNLGDNGAHAGNYAGGQEESEAGLLLQSGGKWYKYRLIFNTTNAGTSTYIILFGIYSSKPTNYVTLTSAGSKDENLQTYWP